jgi:hypothetical protein
MPGPVVPRAPGAISSDRAHWHPAGNGFRGWNSTGRTRVLPPVGALVSPGPNHCLHGIPSGWSHDAPFAVRRPAHRLRHALASTRSGGAVMPGPVFRRPRFSCCACPRGRPSRPRRPPGPRTTLTWSNRCRSYEPPPIGTFVPSGHLWRAGVQPRAATSGEFGRSCSLSAVAPGPLASAGAV